MRKMLHVLRDTGTRRSLCLALAGTLGVGNVLGVSMGIIIGGVGTVFWVFVSGFFSAVIKYCECTLSADDKKIGSGGMHESIKKTYKRLGGPLSYIYCILCLGLALTMGTMLQSNAISSSFFEGYGINRLYSGIAFALVSLLIILFLSDKIDRLTAYIIPITTVVYTLLMLGVIISNIEKLPETIVKIVSAAFKPRGVLASGFVYINALALREGFARGLLSNEAGAGTSAMAETRQDNEPTTVGLMGICEVFFDTTLLCTLTGLAIAISVDGVEKYSTGMDLIIKAIESSTFCSLSLLLPILIFLFAASTVICWYYYGGECIKYLSKGQGALYRLLFIFSVFIGALFNPKSVILLVDCILLFMSVITLVTLKKNSERIFHLSEKSGLLK